MLNRQAEFSLSLCGHEKKIKITMHAFCDEKDINAQNLNAREIACRLNPDLFEVTLFCRNQPDEKLCGKKCARHQTNKAITVVQKPKIEDCLP